MSKSRRLGDENLPPDAAERLDRVCDRFEAAWKAAGDRQAPPRVEDHLVDVPEEERSLALRELHALDEYYRSRLPGIATAADAGAARTEPASTGSIPGSVERPRVMGYEILEVLGRGGMGVVYKARQTSLQRVVALKMILAGGHADEAAMARFHTEAEAIAGLQHPNIVQIHEVGEADGSPYFSLEYCPGGSLEKKLNGTPLPPREAAALVETLARAMEAAHERGVIHRDLKPANILLAEDGTPKIADFGLAKKLEEPGQTRSGAIMGTPSYMSPEQAGGITKSVGPLSDVYALGAILYEVLTGRPPFRAADVMETLLQVISVEPVGVISLQPGIHPDIETICHKCLQKEPARRYVSALELAEDLGRFLRREPVHARPVGRLECSWRWCRRNPVTAGLLTVVLLLLSVGASVATGLVLETGRRAEEERLRSLAEEAKDVAESNAYEAQTERIRALGAEKIAARERDRANQIQYARQLEVAWQEWERGNAKRAGELLAAVRPQACPAGEKELGFEWRFLDHLFRRHGQATFYGHANTVFSVCFSPDGRLIASGSFDRSVSLWDAATGQNLFTFRKHTKPVKSVCFSPDGRRIASGDWRISEPGVVMVWDTATGKNLQTLKGHTGGVNSVCFSPDGTRIASGSGNSEDRGEVKVWDAARGQTLLTLKGHGGSIWSVCFSPDGRWIASSSNDGTVKVWDTATGQNLLTLKGHTGGVNSVCFSPDGRRIASGAHQDNTVRVWDAATGQGFYILKGHTSSIWSVCFSPDGRRIASGGQDETVRVWDEATGQGLYILKGHTHGVQSVCFSSDGRRIASGSVDGTVKVWDAATGQDLPTLKGHTLGITSVCFSPDGTRLASGSGDRKKLGEVKVWDSARGQELFTLHGDTPHINSVCFSPDDRQLVSGGWDGTVKVWDAATGQELLSLHEDTSPVNSVSFSPDGRRVCAGTAGGAVKMWDAATGQELLALRGHGDGIRSLAFSPDGKRIASGSVDRTVKVWDAGTGENLLTLKGDTRGFNSVSFSPDGRRLISGGQDGTVKVWDTATGQELLSFHEDTNPINSVSFSPDGRRVCAGTAGGAVKMWDAATGQELLALRGHRSWVSSLAFSPDGSRIASGGGDATIKIWDAPQGCALRTFEGHTHRITDVCFSSDGQRLVSEDQNGTVIVWDPKSGNQIPGTQEQPARGNKRSPDGRYFVHSEGTLIRLIDLTGGKNLPQQHPWLQPDPAWHEQQAREVEQAGQLFAAAFHQGQLLRHRPWDAGLEVRQANALTRLGRTAEASAHYVQALLVNPHVNLWPLDTGAASRGFQAAQNGDWPRAVADLELAAHQPTALPEAWSYLLLARLASGSKETPSTCRAFLDHCENAIPASSHLVDTCRATPCQEADAVRLVRVAERLVAQRSDATTLNYLGSALYRAGQLEKAVKTLEESNRLHGQGGYPISWLFLGMAQQRLGRLEPARTSLNRYEDWLKGRKFDLWWQDAFWRKLHEEGRQVILTMPRAGDGE